MIVLAPTKTYAIFGNLHIHLQCGSIIFTNKIVTYIKFFSTVGSAVMHLLKPARMHGSKGSIKIIGVIADFIYDYFHKCLKKSPHFTLIGRDNISRTGSSVSFSSPT